MASKLMANAAFEARLLLRPSRQRTVWTVNKLKCPVPGRLTLPPILSFRSYSDSTSTPPFPKSSGSTSTPPFPESSGSTEGSQSSGPKGKNWFSQALESNILSTAVISIAGYFIWVWYTAYRRGVRESAIYDKLKKGPKFKEAIIHLIPRTPAVEEIRELITPGRSSRSYSVVIGEHGTGKTSLIALAVHGINEPKGIVYLDIPDIPPRCDSVMEVAKAMRKALGWSPDQVLDLTEPPSLGEDLQVFSDLAIKYEQEYGKIPVLIIDNANRLAGEHQEVLNLFQDYAKRAADEGRVNVMFVSSEGRVPRRTKAQIYELIGGRMIHLKTLADEITRGRTLEKMREIMFDNAESQLKSAKILRKHRYHEEGAAVIRELLKNGSISRDTLYDLVGVDIGDKFLETNVFAFHFNSRKITFQSTLMKRYCEKNSAYWESGLRTGNQAWRLGLG